LKDSLGLARLFAKIDQEIRKVKKNIISHDKELTTSFRENREKTFTKEMRSFIFAS